MSDFDDQLPYTWAALCEREIGSLEVGATVIRLGFPCVFSVDQATGRLGGVFGLPTGSAWTVTARCGDEWTVERSDGKARQTFIRPPSFRVITLNERSR